MMSGVPDFSDWCARIDLQALRYRIQTVQAEIAARALEIDRLKRELAEAQERTNRLTDALIWCSGSADFGPGGVAREGWLKVAPLLEK